MILTPKQQTDAEHSLGLSLNTAAAAAGIPRRRFAKALIVLGFLNQNPGASTKDIMAGTKLTRNAVEKALTVDLRACAIVTGKGVVYDRTQAGYVVTDETAKMADYTRERARSLGVQLERFADHLTQFLRGRDQRLSDVKGMNAIRDALYYVNEIAAAAEVAATEVADPTAGAPDILIARRRLEQMLERTESNLTDKPSG